MYNGRTDDKTVLPFDLFRKSMETGRISSMVGPESRIPSHRPLEWQIAASGSTLQKTHSPASRQSPPRPLALCTRSVSLVPQSCRR
jgi:hypothetical protein